MGALFSFFRKKKVEPTDYAQILDKIAAEIEEHKKRKAEFLASYKRAISQLLIGFCVVELLLVIWYYFHQKPSEILDHLLHVLPLLLVPVLVFQLKKLISFYYTKRIERCDETIQELIEQQHEKVAELKRITNFTVVSDLLNRYDPETKRRQAAQTPQPKPKPKPKPMPRPQQPPQQPPPQPPHPSYPMPPTPIVRAELPMPSVTPSTPKGDPTLRTPLTYVMPVPKLHNPTPLPPTPAAGQRKGFIDKMVDFLVGDGPEYSVAVTCKQCSAYYANLPKEEVPYAQFTCHNCGYYNADGPSNSERGQPSNNDREKEKGKDKEGETAVAPNGDGEGEPEPDHSDGQDGALKEKTSEAEEDRAQSEKGHDGLEDDSTD